jgi:YqjK-like protein
MSESLRELEARRRVLVLRSERLRADLGGTYRDVETRFAGVDRVFAIARGIASPSVLLSVAGLAFAMLRRVRPFMWVTRGILIVSVVRRILAAVRTLRSASPPARR